MLKEDLSALVEQFMPVTVRLGEDGELYVHDPSDLPDKLQPLERLQLAVSAARVKSTGRALALAIELSRARVAS